MYTSDFCFDVNDDDVAFEELFTHNIDVYEWGKKKKKVKMFIMRELKAAFYNFNLLCY